MSGTFDLERKQIEEIKDEARQIFAGLDYLKLDNRTHHALSSCAIAIGKCLAEIDRLRTAVPATMKVDTGRLVATLKGLVRGIEDFADDHDASLARAFRDALAIIDELEPSNITNPSHTQPEERS